MALAEGTPGNWSPGSYPVAFQLGGHTENVKTGDGKPVLPVTHLPAGPIKLPVPSGDGK
jgi:hypothetical protein